LISNDHIILFSSFLDQILKLRNLGFASKDCLRALEQCNGNLDNAALWLTQNACSVNQFANFLQFAAEGGQAEEGGRLGIVNSASILAFQQLEVGKVWKYWNFSRVAINQTASFVVQNSLLERLHY